MARKVVGVGSVGTRAWVFLLVGRDGQDPLVLQAKEAQASVLEPYLGASEYANHGERVVRGQRMAQAASDVFLGWQRSEGPRRQGARLLRPPAVGLEGVDGPLDDRRIRACTPTRARAAGRWRAPTPVPATDSRSPPTLVAATNFDQAIARFSAAYADQNEHDHQRLADAVAGGDVVATFGV